MPPYPRCDERPPPRRAPRGGFNERFCEPEIAPPCPARGPEAGSAQRYPSVLCFSWYGCEHFVHIRFNNPACYALYTSTDTSGTGMSSPLQVSGESFCCSGTPDDCKPCHFVFDGAIYDGGMIVYNGSAGADQRWTVVFTWMPGGENGVWHTRSVTQTQSGCELRTSMQSDRSRSSSRRTAVSRKMRAHKAGHRLRSQTGRDS
jgi:hypothetical protein